MKKIIFVLGAVFAFGSLVAMNNPKKSLSEELTFRAQAQGQDVTCVLNDKFLDFAYENNKTLKSKDSNCFKASFIKNKESAMAKLQELGGKPVTVFHKDAPDIHCTFFDRDSKVLLVLGVGFPVQRQRMLPFVKLFLDYDLLLFDYRGIALFSDTGLCDITKVTFDGLEMAHSSLKIELCPVELKTLNWQSLNKGMEKFKTTHGHYPEVVYNPNPKNRLYCPTYIPKDPEARKTYLRVVDQEKTPPKQVHSTKDAILRANIGDHLTKTTRLISLFSKNRSCNIIGITFDGIEKALPTLIIDLRWADFKTANWQSLNKGMEKFKTTHGHYPKVIYDPHPHNSKGYLTYVPEDACFFI